MFRSWCAIGIGTGLGLAPVHSNSGIAQPHSVSAQQQEMRHHHARLSFHHHDADHRRAAAKKARTAYSALLAVGVTSLILSQALLNIFAVLGMAPLTGAVMPT